MTENLLDKFFACCYFDIVASIMNSLDVFICIDNMLTAVVNSKPHFYTDQTLPCTASFARNIKYVLSALLIWRFFSLSPFLFLCVSGYLWKIIAFFILINIACSYYYNVMSWICFFFNLKFSSRFEIYSHRMLDRSFELGILNVLAKYWPINTNMFDNNFFFWYNLKFF